MQDRGLIFVTAASTVGLLCSLMILAGCMKTYQFVPTEFPQPEVKNEYRSLAKEFTRSANVYSEFETKLLCDALYYSDRVALASVEMHCNRKGKVGAARQEVVQKAGEDLSKFLTFYILADIRDPISTSLVEKNSPWAVYLVGEEPDQQGQPTGNRVTVMPAELKEADMEPEIKTLFGTQHSAFKTLYKAQFNRFDEKGREIVLPNGPLTLVLSSITADAQLNWNIDKKKDKVTKVKTEKTVIKKKQVDSDVARDMYWL